MQTFDILRKPIVLCPLFLITLFKCMYTFITACCARENMFLYTDHSTCLLPNI